MSTVSNIGEILSFAYSSEHLPVPAIMPWPLNPRAEEDRKGRETAFRDNLAANPPPGLAWISGHADAKYRPDFILEGCRSVLVSSLGYFRDDPIDHTPVPAGVPSDVPSSPRRPVGRVSRYARGRDYHKELGNRLRRIARALSRVHPGHSFRAFTDIGPLDETWLAEASGLGFKGRNTLAIMPGTGSWAFLGHIITTLPLEASPGRPSPLSCPQGCRRCIDACPTGALSPPGRLDAHACISTHLIETQGSLSADYAAPTSDRIFGCDACQEVCPFNAKVNSTGVEAFLKDIAGASPDLVRLLSLKNHQDTVDSFAGSPLMRPGREGLVRNACIVAGNSGDRNLIPLLQLLLDDGNEAIRIHARRALEILR